ncbi:MAG: hypothetical protein KJ061_08110 [Vicinamibacteraceae bacterium]|nr:hypothetical protein [Vicinamibacteraceae bacterium]
MNRRQQIAEFWTLSHAGDAVRCVAADHPYGVELQYLMNDHPLITRVFESWDDLTGQARLWREHLEAQGWKELRARQLTLTRH